MSNLVLKYPIVIEKARDLDLLPNLIETLLQGSADIRIEAMLCLHNIFCKCDENSFSEFLSVNVFAAVSKNLDSINAELIISTLNTLFQILQRTQIQCQKLSTLIFQKLRELNIITLVEGLTSSKNEVVAEKACKMIDIFFKCTN